MIENGGDKPRLRIVEGGNKQQEEFEGEWPAERILKMVEKVYTFARRLKSSRAGNDRDNPGPKAA